jgi:phage shock protein A
MGSISEASAFDTFDRMAEKVDRMESEADALAELSDLSADSNLEDKFRELESSGGSADLLLEELKAKMQGKVEDAT